MNKGVVPVKVVIEDPWKAGKVGSNRKGKRKMEERKEEKVSDKISR